LPKTRKFGHAGIDCVRHTVSKSSPELPLGPVRDLLAWWRKAKVEGLIIGGLAVAFLGRPRTTRDVDAIIFLEEDQWLSFLKKGEAFSFLSRLPDPLPFARQNRMLLVRHEKSAIDVDLSLGALPFEWDALKRVKMVRIGRLSVPLPTPEDLIILKAIANRPKDEIDIDGLLDSNDDVDLARIRKHVDEFAQALEMPELYETIDRMLVRHNAKKRRRKK
jgi:hypothetical protein